MGSGLNRTFEKELLFFRSDLKITSLDPSLGIVGIDQKGMPTTQGFKVEDLGPRGAIYRREDLPSVTDKSWIYRDQQMIDYDKTRKKWLTIIPGAVAGLASALPIEDGSSDLIIDFCGPIQYLKTKSEKQKYLEEVKRVKILCKHIRRR